MFRTDSGAPRHVSSQLPPGDGIPSLPRPVAASRQTAIDRALKRSIDIVGALTFLTLMAPLYAFIMLCVRISMGSPVHFGQVRLGQGGRRFRFYKFRSMVHDSEAVLDDFLSRNDMARTEWDTFQKLEKDPRITWVGNVIRKLSLDEIPQFWNVLKGDMSLVGPRPCMERQRSLYGRGWESYCAMRPGLTGLWQVSGRNRLPYAKRVELDIHYVQNWSLWLDLTILAKTVKVVLTGDGSR